MLTRIKNAVVCMYKVSCASASRVQDFLFLLNFDKIMEYVGFSVIDESGKKQSIKDDSN